MDLRSKGRGTGFKVGGVPPQPLIRRREVWLVFLIALLALICLSYVVDYTGEQPEPQGPAPEELVDRLLPMPLPDIAALAEPDLGDLDDRQAAHVQFLLERPDLVSKNIFGPGPEAYSWLDARLAADREQRPLYQRFSGEDIMRGQLPIGAAFVADGVLVDLDQAHGKDWGVVSLGPDLYAAVRANSVGDDVVVGENVRLSGRLLGRKAYETDSGETVQVPILGSDRIQPTPPELELAKAFALPLIGADGSLPTDDSVFDEIDDIHPSLELRPYYYLLGVVSRNDRYQTDPYAGADSLVGKSIAIHKDPEPWRGKPMTFQGYVLYSFEDTQVAQDKPFGIERVLRIICYNKVYGPYTERDVEGKEQTSMRWVRQAYELAVIGDHEPPPRGAFIRATGRFLKVHGVPAKANKRLDEANEVTRHSDNVYFKFLITNDFVDATPGDIDWTPLRIAFLSLVPLIVIWIVILERSDNRKQAKRPEHVRKLRATRRKLAIDKAPAAQAAAAESADEAENGSDDGAASGETPPSV